MNITNSIFYLLNGFRNSLDRNRILAKAVRATGLSDWGEWGFREPFERLIDALNYEAGLDHQGRFILRQYYHRLLCNLLKLVEEWKLHPEIAETDVGAPIFIIGCPRTGTTFLHGLLAQDSANRTMQYWELLFPSPAPDPQTYDSDRRIKKAKWFVENINLFEPKLSIIHPLEATAPEECCFIFDHLFLDNIHHPVFDVPSYIEWYDRHDPVPSYRFHKRMLQHYGWQFDFERFALKAPRHLYCLEALLTVYPDAQIVWTHRTPCEAVPSLCSLMEHARGIVVRETDLYRLGHLCLEHFDKDAQAGWKARQNGNAEQFFDVDYRRLIQYPADTVREIYEHFGLDYSPQFEEQLQHHLQKEIQRKRKPHVYTMERYGLHTAEIQKRLEWYLDRFGV